MQVRPLETISGTDKIDWHKPFVMKVDDTLPKVQAAMNDPNVVSALQSFYSGFPGSAAALQGSKRFTTPLKETQALRTDILQELGKTVDPSPEGLCSRFASNLTQTAASVVLLLLLICSGGKGTPLHDALLGLQSWGYGEDMVSSGLDNLQFHPCACKRMATGTLLCCPWRSCRSTFRAVRRDSGQATKTCSALCLLCSRKPSRATSACFPTKSSTAFSPNIHSPTFHLVGC